MKKLKLKALQLGNMEVLTRKQLKNVLGGGFGSGSTTGSATGSAPCPTGTAPCTCGNEYVGCYSSAGCLTRCGVKG
jgi:hypothetical protein